MAQHDDLIGYEEFAPLIPGTSRRAIIYAARRGRFPPFFRATPKAAPMWSRAAVTAHVAKLRAGLEIKQ